MAKRTAPVKAEGGEDAPQIPPPPKNRRESVGNAHSDAAEILRRTREREADRSASGAESPGMIHYRVDEPEKRQNPSLEDLADGLKDSTTEEDRRWAYEEIERYFEAERQSSPPDLRDVEVDSLAMIAGATFLNGYLRRSWIRKHVLFPLRDEYAQAVFDVLGNVLSRDGFARLLEAIGTDGLIPAEESENPTLFRVIHLVASNLENKLLFDLDDFLRDHGGSNAGAAEPIERQGRLTETPDDAARERPTEGRQAIASAIRSLAASLPADYERRSEGLADALQAARQELVAQLTSALSAKMQEMPHESYEDKKELAKFINAELRKFGLTIKCPKTGRPASLGAGLGNHPTQGRFHLLTQTEDGKRHQTIFTPHLSTLLDQFELMADDPDRKRWGKWTDQVRRGGESAKRG